jgi:2-amino-4-hydroxy-6-hydroxymethyldihydropteridine diphosphokinase
MEKIVSYIGLGSNLGNREQTIKRALELLEETPGVHVSKVSPLEETEPIGPAQPKFLNGVAVVETTLPALALLDRLQMIEDCLGRERKEHWGPRKIDLDILYYGQERIANNRLTVPHPQISRRDFVQRELKQVGFDG